MTVAINGKPLGTYALTPSSTGCTTAGAFTQCSFTVGIPSGNDTFAIDLFASTNGTGTPLSSGQVTEQILPAKLNVIALTLTGDVASVKVKLGNPAPAAGTAAAIPVYVTAYDASGAAIVGPGNYNVPITITDSDSSGVTGLSGATVTGPGGGPVLSYNGKSFGTATIGASATGVSTVTTATFAPTPTAVTILTLPPAISASHINGMGVGPDVAGGPNTDVWVNTFGVPSDAIVKITTSGTATAFLGGTNGLTNDNYEGIARGPDGNMWFGEYNKKIGVITPDGSSVNEYGTGLSCNPNDIVAGPPGDSGLWVTEFYSTGPGTITHIDTSGGVNNYTIAGSGKWLGNIILGKDGNLYVIDYTGGGIIQLVTNAGNLVGSSEIFIPKNPLTGGFNNSLNSLAQTGDGVLWFTDDSFSTNTLGNVVINPTTFSSSTINQYLANFPDPTGIANVPAGSQTLWVALGSDPLLEEAVAPAGGGQPALADFTPNLPQPVGQYTEYLYLTVGPDGYLWAVNYNGSITKLAY